MDCERQIASSGPALLISFSEGINIASSKRVFEELGWFRQILRNLSRDLGLGVAIMAILRTLTLIYFDDGNV
jgi:hypothetical protein